VLTSHGFKELAAFPEPDSPADVLGGHVIMARTAIPESLLKERDSGGDGIAEKPLISPLNGRTDPENPEASAGPREDFPARLKQAPPHERIDLLAEYVRSRVMRVLRRDGSKPIDRRHRLMDLGIDSLMAVELRNILSSGLGLDRPLPVTLIYDYPSVDAISDYLAVSVLHLGRQASDAPPKRRVENAAPRFEASNIKELSDEEVERLLLKKLEGL
jgi:acyl carrier protein